MKILFAALAAAIALIWFADVQVGSYRLSIFTGGQWMLTNYGGWGIFKGLWVFFIAIIFATALILTGFVACLRYDIDRREKSIRKEFENDNMKALKAVGKNYFSAHESMQKTLIENKKLKRSLDDVIASEEEGIKKRDGVIKGQDAIINRLKRKIQRMQVKK